MNIKRRLRFSYILMLLIPVLLIFLSGQIILEIYDPVQEFAKLPRTFNIELYSILSEDPEKLLEKEILEKLERLSGYEGRANIVVSRDRNMVNRLGINAEEATRGRRSSMFVSTDWDFHFSDGIPGEITFFVFDSNKLAGAYFSVGGVILAAIIILLITNGLISWYMTKTITKPLNILEEAAHKIKEEDLETKVIYKGNDEFKRVCIAFEEMRIRLKDSLNKQIKYEENRKELIANISHDLKTPITAIKGYLIGIRDDIADTPEKVEKYLNTIYNKSILMNSLIDRLLLFSKLDMGKIEFNFQKVVLGAFLEDIIEELQLDYPSIDLNFPDAESEIAIMADISQMHRVITNIIDNAHKYSDSNNTSVEVSLKQKGQMVEVSISDNGPGIDVDGLPHIFQSFYRGDPSRSSRKEGSGLGLSIVNQIIKAHGGTVAARPSKRGGLEILISLRIADEEDTDN